ncbi:diaminopimelate epimerase [Chungangia koreensis]|uniref:Diaminopimelate epimerase n=1 Tax=Chungangia koreensis TaxID=752657 RepID=A0ABV8X8F2_9LACT
MDFYRYNGLGNDYLVMDPQKTEFKVDGNSAKVICDRHFGEGSDGILFGPLFDDEGVIGLKIFNPDGSLAEKSGNGTRIFARYLVDEGYVTGEKPFKFNTDGGMVSAHVIDKKEKIKMGMGQASFQSTKIPATGESREMVNEKLMVKGSELTVSCVSMGNPHCVVPLEDISSDLAHELGPLIETHPLFPNRTNVQFLKVLDRNNIQIEIWERGAGYTLASGSSSCAAASVAVKLGLIDRQVTVHMPGGTLAIDMDEEFNVNMTGPVAFVSKGYLAEELRELF